MSATSAVSPGHISSRVLADEIRHGKSVVAPGEWRGSRRLRRSGRRGTTFHRSAQNKMDGSAGTEPKMSPRH